MRSYENCSWYIVLHTHWLTGCRHNVIQLCHQGVLYHKFAFWHWGLDMVGSRFQGYLLLVRFLFTSLHHVTYQTELHPYKQLEWLLIPPLQSAPLFHSCLQFLSFFPRAGSWARNVLHACMYSPTWNLNSSLPYWQSTTTFHALTYKESADKRWTSRQFLQLPKSLLTNGISWKMTTYPSDW